MALNAAVLMFGPPGSGKGTQAVLLSDCLKAPHISTGDILREHVAAGDELGREVEALMRSGALVPDGLVNRIVEERIGRPDCAGGFILDGYPRTLEQAQALIRWLEPRGMDQVVVDLRVDYNRIVTRIISRRQCPVCGAAYNLVFNPPRTDETCDREGARLMARPDDQPAVIWKRIETYERQTLPLLGYFRSAGYGFIEIDGNYGTPEEIAGRLCAEVAKAADRERAARSEG